MSALRFALPLAGVLALTGCLTPPNQPLSINDQAAVACESYSSSLAIITPFKPKMSLGQIQFVDQANDLILPMCLQIGSGLVLPTADILNAINGKLSEMILLQQSLNAGRN